jgi:hypothetical protein
MLEDVLCRSGEENSVSIEILLFNDAERVYLREINPA